MILRGLARSSILWRVPTHDSYRAFRQMITLVLHYARQKSRRILHVTLHILVGPRQAYMCSTRFTFSLRPGGLQTPLQDDRPPTVEHLPSGFTKVPSCGRLHLGWSSLGGIGVSHHYALVPAYLRRSRPHPSEAYIVSNISAIGCFSSGIIHGIHRRRFRTEHRVPVEIYR